MCILGVAVGVHPSWPFILVHNRDEDPGRATSPPVATAGVLCGTDVAHGGTWLGYAAAPGVAAALVNYRSARDGGPPGAVHVSRGLLVRGVLERPREHAALFTPGEAWLCGAYAGFSMVVADLSARGGAGGVFLVTNRPGGSCAGAYAEGVSGDGGGGGWRTRVVVTRLPPGVHVISNSVLEDPSWPKVVWLHEQLERLIAGMPRDAGPFGTLRDGVLELMCARVAQVCVCVCLCVFVCCVCGCVCLCICVRYFVYARM
jgi:uncharacterized protein with NRDE domain